MRPRARQRSSTTILWLGTVSLCLATSIARSQDQGPGILRPDSVLVLSVSDTGISCFASDRFVVVESQRPGEVGSDFFIRSKEGNRCESDSLAGDVVLRDEWAAYFSSMRDNVLILDSGTGPDIRYLILIDMHTGDRIAELPYVETEVGPDPLTLGVWMGSELDEPLPDCEPPSGGLIPGVDSLFLLNIRTGETQFADRIRCANRQ